MRVRTDFEYVDRHTSNFAIAYLHEKKTERNGFSLIIRGPDTVVCFEQSDLVCTVVGCRQPQDSSGQLTYLPHVQSDSYKPLEVR